MPFPEQPDQEFTEERILRLPEGESGVYGIFNAARWIYIEQTQDLRARLLEHVRMQSAEYVRILGERPTGWCAEFAAAPQIDYREAALIREFQPRCNQHR
jgi:predicted GIY-YIG superfamily endonuclease